MSNVKRIFSRADRERILSLAVGKPTGVIVEIGGFELNLVPLTPSQASGIFSLLDAFSKLDGAANENGEVVLTRTNLLQLIAKEGDRVIDLARAIVYKTAKANGLIGPEDGKQVFDEWFDDLDFFETVRTLVPAIIEASGMKSLLGNRSTPPIDDAVQTTHEPEAAGATPSKE